MTEPDDAVDIEDSALPNYQPFPSFGEFALTSEHDATLFDEWAARIDALRDDSGPDALREAVSTATRIAAVDTGALEGLYRVDRGFTISAAASMEALQAAHLQVGQEAQRHIEDALAGYEYVLDIATGERSITEHAISELHAIICASQETYEVVGNGGAAEPRPLPKGVYKEFTNNPYRGDGSAHAYAPPGLITQTEMARLIENLSSGEFAAAPPILQAAYAHYAYVCIHPFADGNGRVARALASAYLYRRPGIPLVIFADEKATYFGALELADSGSSNAFVQFVAERAIDTILWLETAMRRPVVPSAESTLAQLAGTLLTAHGISHAEIDQLEDRVRQAFTVTFAEEIARLGLTDADAQVWVSQQNRQVVVGGLEGYRRPSAVGLEVVSHSKPPASAQIGRSYYVAVPRSASDAERRELGIPIGVDFAIFRNASDRLVDVRIRDVYPAVTESLRMRLRSVVESEVAALVAAAVEIGQASLRDGGYI